MMLDFQWFGCFQSPAFLWLFVVGMLFASRRSFLNVSLKVAPFVPIYARPSLRSPTADRRCPRPSSALLRAGRVIPLRRSGSLQNLPPL